MLFSGGIIFSKAKIFLIGCLTFIFGIGLASFLPASPAGGPVVLLQYKIWWFTATVFFLILTVLFWRNGVETRTAGTGRDPSLRLVFLFIAIFLFSFWRYAVSLPVRAPDKIWYYNLPAQAGGQTVTVLGLVANEPDIRETSQKLEIRAQGICAENSGRGQPCPYRKISGKLLATTDLYPEYNYGDRLEIVCELKAPEQFDDFAYDRYLARYDIYSVCYWPKITLSSEGGGNLIYQKIFAFKKIMAGLIESGLSEPESSLARPIVFGGQKGLDQATRDNFQKTGLTHIMAVSGFNISIISAIVMAALLALGFSRRQAFYLAVIFLAGYIVLVGAPASALRAGLMGFLVLWALKLGRLNKMTNSLVLTAAVLLTLNPKLLRDDVGFQLSFLAIAGLVYAYPILEALWQNIKLPKPKGISDALLITLAAQVLTWPVLAYNFSQISLIAPLANLAVLWAVPLLTVLILAALPLAALWPGLAFIFFSPSLILTKYILAAVKYFAGWPHSYLTIDYLWPGWLVLYYFLVIFIIIKLKRSKLLSQEINGKIQTGK